MSLKTLNADLTIEKKQFTNETGKSIDYYDVKLVLASGATVPVKVDKAYAQLIVDGYLG